MREIHRRFVFCQWVNFLNSKKQKKINKYFGNKWITKNTKDKEIKITEFNQNLLFSKY